MNYVKCFDFYTFINISLVTGVYTVNLIVNDEKYTHTGAGSISALLAEIGANQGQVAVMVNGTIVSAEQHDKYMLACNDKIELLVFAGGG